MLFAEMVLVSASKKNVNERKKKQSKEEWSRENGLFGITKTILDSSGSFWTVFDRLHQSDLFGPFWTVRGHYGQFWALLDHMDHSGPFWTIFNLKFQKRYIFLLL